VLYELLVHLGVLDRHKRDQILQLLWMKWPPVGRERDREERERKKDREREVREGERERERKREVREREGGRETEIQCVCSKASKCYEEKESSCLFGASFL
jgi:hypothetical protein